MTLRNIRKSHVKREFLKIKQQNYQNSQPRAKFASHVPIYLGLFFIIVVVQYKH